MTVNPNVCGHCAKTIHIMIFRNSGYCSDRCGKKLGKVK